MSPIKLGVVVIWRGVGCVMSPPEKKGQMMTTRASHVFDDRWGR